MSAARESLGLAAGCKLGRYRLEKIHAAWGFYLTYLAEDTTSGRAVAVHELVPEEFVARAADGSVRGTSEAGQKNLDWACARFAREGRGLASCAHPALQKVIEVIEANGTVYWVTPRDEPRTFKSWLQDLGHAPTEVELRPLLGPVLGALERAHSAMLRHLNLKPEAIQITAAGAPVLTHFAGARQAIARRCHEAVAVTDGYSAPEQYDLEKTEDVRTDIYSLAAVLHRALTGQPPPQAERRKVQDTFAPLAGRCAGRYRAGFLAALDAALALDPTARPPSVVAWRKMLGIAPEDGIRGYVRQHPRRAVAGAAVAVGVALWLAFRPEPEDPRDKQTDETQREEKQQAPDEQKTEEKTQADSTPVKEDPQKQKEEQAKAEAKSEEEKKTAGQEQQEKERKLAEEMAKAREERLAAEKEAAARAEVEKQAKEEMARAAQEAAQAAEAAAAAKRAAAEAAQKAEAEKAAAKKIAAEKAAAQAAEAAAKAQKEAEQAAVAAKSAGVDKTLVSAQKAAIEETVAAKALAEKAAAEKLAAEVAARLAAAAQAQAASKKSEPAARQAAEQKAAEAKAAATAAARERAAAEQAAAGKSVATADSKEQAAQAAAELKALQAQLAMETAAVEKAAAETAAKQARMAATNPDPLAAVGLAPDAKTQQARAMEAAQKAEAAQRDAESATQEKSKADQWVAEAAAEAAAARKRAEESAKKADAGTPPQIPTSEQVSADKAAGGKTAAENAARQAAIEKSAADQRAAEAAAQKAAQEKMAASQAAAAQAMAKKAEEEKAAQAARDPNQGKYNKSTATGTPAPVKSDAGGRKGYAAMGIPGVWETTATNAQGKPRRRLTVYDDGRYEISDNENWKDTGNILAKMGRIQMLSDAGGDIIRSGFKLRSLSKIVTTGGLGDEEWQRVRASPGKDPNQPAKK